MDVDRTIELLESAAPGEVHQGIARQHAAGALGEREQQRVLKARQRLLPVVDAHLAGRAVDFQAAEAQHIRRCGVAAPPQNRTQPREQLAGLERLRQIVIRPQLEADHAVERVAARRQHQERNRGFGADVLAEVQAIRVRQHQVEDDRIEGVALEEPLRLAAGAGDRRADARLTEIVGDHSGQAGIVLDQQYTNTHAAAILPPASGFLPVVVALHAGDEGRPLLGRQHFGRVGQPRDEPLRCLIGEADLVRAHGLEPGAIDGFR